MLSSRGVRWLVDNSPLTVALYPYGYTYGWNVQGGVMVLAVCWLGKEFVILRTRWCMAIA